MTIPNQYMIYHFTEWDTDKQKWKKKPVALDGSALPLHGGIPTSTDRDQVVGAVNALCSDDPQRRYRLGLWLQPGMFLLDLDDDAVDMTTGQLTPLAALMAAPLVAAGCYFEASSSGRGAHVIGRYSGELPAHAVNRKAVHPHEFFTEGRGCVLSELSQGSWDVDVTPLVLPLLREHFPPRVQPDQLHALTTGPRPAWRGPTDDDELIRRMLSATGSGLARLQGKTRLSDLWSGQCERDSESDMALAAHLAFWTGCDADRMDRLMRRSAMRRAKWDEQRGDVSYLRFTINNVCATTDTVYQELARVDTAAALLGASRPAVAPAPVISDAVIVGEAGPQLTDWFTFTEQAVLRVNSAGTLRELFEEIFPAIAASGVPPVHGETITGAAARKLDSLGSKQPLARIRALLMPPKDMAAMLTEVVVPEWAQSIVYVLATDSYFDISTATEYSVTGLRAKFSRMMPMKANGQREDPAQWLQDRWGITAVDDLEYRPNTGSVFEADGRMYANSFRASSIPTPAIGSAEATVCITLFQQHLYAMVNHRDVIYQQLLGWIAHNARHPGRKIRWSPLLQGSAGVGKSIFTELFNACLGRSNVKSTSSATLSNSGGFTDWAIGAAVNVIEELKLDSKESRRLYNTMKTYIADDDIDVNRKGRAAGRKMVNVTNHWANSNYRGTLPIDMGDRRWCVIFTPWEDANAAARSKGLASADELPPYFNRIGNSMRGEPGAWRSWLLGIDLGFFNPDGRAPFTEEREAMRQGSGDFLEQTIEDCIVRGGTGVGLEAFCSHSLMGMVNVALGEKPDNRSWNRILGELGYQQHPKTIWWNGRARRVWTKISRSNEDLRDFLDKTSQQGVPL